jgi:serine/threonine protein kinase/Flp pilus assembly protein TadD
MRQRWAAGERVPAEALLDRRPDLRQQPNLALKIIYEEICLRQERGQSDCFAELVRRFPQWQKQLDGMCEGQRLLEPAKGAPRFPRVGEAVAGFCLLKELGRGISGRVFLASQPGLGDRPVVIKLTAIHGHEHLNLARLQHTHIVPLYTLVDDHSRHIRILCMPYFGGRTLDHILVGVARAARAQTSVSLAETLKTSGIEVTGAAEAILSQLSYEKGICWIGMCLANALHYAHESGLVHFDMKPSNVLIAADGQPMLLDFHLAQPPLQAGAPFAEHLGGTPGYMPPEQQLALAALAHGEPIPRAVDRQVDVFALGAILYEALGGHLPYQAGVSRPLTRLNPRISQGLSDIVANCLKSDAAARYGTAAALEEDLRRHLHDQPLVGVRNHSWHERYQKWRRRHPSAGRTVLLLSVLLLAVSALSVGLFVQRQDSLREAEAALDEGGKTWRQRGHFQEARARLQQGLANVKRIPWPGDLPAQFNDELRHLEQAEAASRRSAALHQIHELAEHARALYGTTLAPSKQLVELQTHCQALWRQRHKLKQYLQDAAAADAVTAETANDLLDVVLFAAEVNVQLAPKEKQAEAGWKALAALDEAEELFGPSLVLQHERERRRSALRLPVMPPRAEVPPAKTAWEHCVLGRTFLQAGDLNKASEQLRKAVALQRHGFWPNFYLGLCAHRLGEHDEALVAFSVCIGSSPRVAAAYFNRALCFTARRHLDEALQDYDSALKLDPTLAAAALNRGMLHFEAKRLTRAQSDLDLALSLGANPVAVHCNLAMVHAANHDKAAALAALEIALRHEPDNPRVHALLKSLDR